MTDRKNPTPGFWFTVALVAALVGYPLSYGVCAWLWWRDKIPHSIEPALAWFYTPFTWAITNGPEPLSSAVKWYGDLGR